MAEIASSQSAAASRQHDQQIPVEKNPPNHAEADGNLESRKTSEDIPNGGFRAWLQVLGAFFLFFNTWGIINSYGAFQTYYEQDLLSTSSASAISWIGSFQSFLIMFTGFATGPMYDAGYFYQLLVTGLFLVSFGHMMLSLCRVYWQVLLAQAFCIGIGAGTLFVPSVAILSTYFTTKISFAVGIAASGASIGGVIYPIVFRELQVRVGFAWSTRIIGFIALGGLALSNIIMRVRMLPASSRKIVDLSALKEVPYSLFTLGLFISFMGAYTPFFYIQLFASQRHLTQSNLSFYLLSVLNSTSTVGRILPNFMADIVGPFNMIVPCAVTCGILILCLLAVNTQAQLLAIVALYGFFSGSFVSLSPSILVALSPNRGVIGTRMGMCFSVMAVSLLIGTPIAGTILSSKGFSAVWIYGGLFTTIGGAILAVARGFHAEWRWDAKV